MKNLSFRKLFPHLVAVVSFILIAIVYCKPALEGKVLQQGDIIHWKGMSKDIQDYRDQHNGRAPLWTTSMFGGMPGFQIATNNNNYLSYYANEVFSLFIPKPFRFFILACLGFYFLALVFRVNPWLSMMGAIAYAYCSFDPIIIAAGHDTQMLSLAYMPALLGALVMVFRGNYWIGGALTGLFSSILIYHNHYQITYYSLLLCTVVGLGFTIKYIREKKYTPLIKSVVVLVVAGALGVLTNAVMLFTTYDYAKATIRGGGQSTLHLSDSTMAEKTNDGLDREYAFRWSYGIPESFTLLVPNIYGGVSQPLGEESKLVEAMNEKGLPPQFANQLYGLFPSYWGGQPFTSGPVYIGAIIFLLFIFGMVYLKSRHKWWIFGVTLLGIMMAWGKNFPVLNNLLFDHLPMYNKFRVPTMTLVIPQLTFPLMAVLTLQQLFYGGDSQEYIWKKLKKAGLITAGIFVILLLLYFGLDYRNGQEKEIQQQLNQVARGDLSLGKDLVNAVIDDRKSLFAKDLLRSFFFVVAGFIMLFMYARNKLKVQPVLIGLFLLSLIDLLSVGKRYLSADQFLEPEDFESAFAPTPADLAIKQDKEPNFRVLNLTQDVFNDAITSYHHKSIGGYHAAKLSLYQDLIENQLSKQPMNQEVINMLNTKYIITRDSTGRVYAQLNPGALGSCWLVSRIEFVKDKREEMKALDQFDPRSTAVVQEMFRKDIPFNPQVDSTASIQLEKNENDLVTYDFNSAANQFAVFSEIYYDRGWKAFIDGKETPIIKVNYVLRGLPVPAGRHKIEFHFEPRSYQLGSRVTGFSQLLLLAAMALGIFLQWKQNRKTLSIT